jgi:hypothetical protein
LQGGAHGELSVLANRNSGKAIVWNSQYTTPEPSTTAATSVATRMVSDRDDVAVADLLAEWIYC